MTTDFKARQAARQAAAQALAATHPHLTPVGACKGGALVAAAKNLRAELKAAFPGVKFSVKTSRFSGGDSIDIAWTDGPTGAQVDAIADRYQGGNFDGMTDSYTYERNAWRDAFGDAKYVHGARSNTLQAVASALRTVRARYHGVPATATAEDYQTGRLMSVRREGAAYDLQSEVYQVLCRRTWCITRPLPAPVGPVA